MSSKYEKLIDLIINEEQDKARALFHRIVVEQSRKIYEDIMSEEEGEEELVADEEVIDGDEEGMAAEEGDDAGDEFEAGDEAGDDAGEEELEDRVLDLESAIDELKAEFDQLMSEEEGEEAHADVDAGDDDFAGDVDSDDEGDDEEEGDLEEAMIREYVEKVASPGNSEGQAVGTGRSSSVNKQSTVAGKNDMGGTAKNLGRADRNEDPDGTSATKKPSNAYTKGEGKLIGKVENSPGANTKGYSKK